MPDPRTMTDEDHAEHLDMVAGWLEGYGSVVATATLREAARRLRERSGYNIRGPFEHGPDTRFDNGTPQIRQEARDGE